MRGLVLDAGMVDELVRERKRRGIDLHDEVWEGVYVFAPPPPNVQQAMVGDLCLILGEALDRKTKGTVFPGVNVSDRRKNWEHNFRVPDVVVVLKKSRAVDCDTHFAGGPDFLIEIEVAGGEGREKVPFYSQVGVRELLVLELGGTRMWLYRHDGDSLGLVEPVAIEGKGWLSSELVPLMFRRTRSKGTSRTLIRRTDGLAGCWTI